MLIMINQKVTMIVVKLACLESKSNLKTTYFTIGFSLLGKTVTSQQEVHFSVSVKKNPANRANTVNAEQCYRINKLVAKTLRCIS